MTSALEWHVHASHNIYKSFFAITCNLSWNYCCTYLKTLQFVARQIKYDILFMKRAVNEISTTLQKHLLQIVFWKIYYENIVNSKYTFLCWWYVVFTRKKNTSNMEVFTEGHVWWSINQTLSSYTTTACRRSFASQDWGLQKVNLYGMQEKMIFSGQEKGWYSDILFSLPSLKKTVYTSSIYSTSWHLYFLSTHIHIFIPIHETSPKTLYYC